MDLEVMMNGLKVTAIPDTGADINVMTVKTLGFLERCSEKHEGEADLIRIGNATSTQALFKVAVTCRLPNIYPGRQKSFTAVFHVFRTLASGVKVIVGSEFLKITHVLTTQASRLKPRFNPTGHIARCMSIGPISSTGLRFRIFLNLFLCFALPDTGSEINLMSRAFAVERFEIVPIAQSDMQQVEFADGQVEQIFEKVVVTVQAADFNGHLENATDLSRFSLCYLPRPTQTVKDRSLEESPTQIFYILASMPHDVILSQSLLYSMDAWNLHQPAFESVPMPLPIEEPSVAFCSNFWVRTKKQVAVKDTSKMNTTPSLLTILLCA